MQYIFYEFPCGFLGDTTYDLDFESLSKFTVDPLHARYGSFSVLHSGHGDFIFHVLIRKAFFPVLCELVLWFAGDGRIFCIY